LASLTLPEGVKYNLIFLPDLVVLTLYLHLPTGMSPPLKIKTSTIQMVQAPALPGSVCREHHGVEKEEVKMPPPGGLFFDFFLALLFLALSSARH